MNLSEWTTSLGETVKGAAKIALQSRRCQLRRSAAGRSEPLIVMGNGPSLGEVITKHVDKLSQCDTLSVNFAANDSSFAAIRPKYYMIVDPHFFAGGNTDPNVHRLMDNLSKVDWPMMLIVPAQGVARNFTINNPHIEIARINSLGIEGFDCFTHFTFRHRLGMPRPRNVLIPALMSGIWMGYNDIYILGADHSWMRTLSVDSRNRVVSVQPHFYEDNHAETERVADVYGNVKLHEVIRSFYVAFKAYHEIERYARGCGVRIVNATPGSFIDAFGRGEWPATQPDTVAKRYKLTDNRAMDFKTTNYSGRPTDDNIHRSEAELAVYDFLDCLGIQYTTLCHPAAFTMEECEAVRREIGAPVFKNLFLTNRRGTEFYLLMLPADKVFKTKYLSSQLGCARLSFATAEAMEQYLHIHPGAVSPMGLIHDRANIVRLIIDEDLRDVDIYACHPCVNTSSIALKLSDLLDKVIPSTGHGYTWVKLPDAGPDPQS